MFCKLFDDKFPRPNLNTAELTLCQLNEMEALKTAYRFSAVSWVTWGRFRLRFANDKKFLV